MSALPMEEFLRAVAMHDVHVPEVLIERGIPAKVIEAKAEKAARRGYTDYGTTCWRPWLTDKGRAFLASADTRPYDTPETE